VDLKLIVPNEYRLDATWKMVADKVRSRCSAPCDLLHNVHNLAYFQLRYVTLWHNTYVVGQIIARSKRSRLTDGPIHFFNQEEIALAFNMFIQQYHIILHISCNSHSIIFCQMFEAIDV
jgi:hypothetical protein